MLRPIFWRAVVPVVALMGGFVGGCVILPWGLVTPLFVVWPLALGFGTLLAALGASWIDTLLAPGLTRSRLPWVVLAAEVTAAALAVAFSSVPMLVPLIFLLAFGAVVIASATSWAEWCFRGPGERVGRDVGFTLVLATAVLTLSVLSLNGSGVRPVRGVSVGVAAVVLGVILARRRFPGPGDRIGKDDATTLVLAGLPAPLFFGAYYLASLFDLTSG